MYSKIIDLIWSDSLKSRIKETKYTFSEYQLLMIIISMPKHLSREWKC